MSINAPILATDSTIGTNLVIQGNATTKGDLNVTGKINAVGSYLHYTKIYLWNQGMPAVQMIPASQGVCFLTYVRGKFNGGKEFVQTFVANVQGVPYWFLGGGSDQSSVAAKAVCIEGIGPATQ